MKTKLNIGTHNGVFHADEIVAMALYRAYIEDNVELVRTRNPQELSSCDVKIDVGGEYAPTCWSSYYGDYMSMTQFRGYAVLGEFDHHQFREGDELYGLSSAGLIFKALTEPMSACCDMGECPWVDTVVSEPSQSLLNLVTAVDARDTRVEYDKWKNSIFCQDVTFDMLFNAISGCNQLDIASKEQDDMFNTLTDLFTKYFKGTIEACELYKTISEIASNTQKEAESKINKIKNTVKVKGQFVYFEDFQSFPMAAKWLWDNGYGTKIFVSYDKLQNNWTYQVDTDVQKIVSVSNTVFVHTNGFIAKSLDDMDTVVIDLEEVTK